MEDYSKYLTKFLINSGINISTIPENTIHQFASETHITEAIQNIQKLQKEIMTDWRIRTRILDFMNLSMTIPNGTEGVKYEHKIDRNKLTQSEIIYFEFSGLDEVGLVYEQEEGLIKGIPSTNGAFKIGIKFRVEGEAEHTELHIKEINFVSNPDPKSLWKNIPSDENALYWKPDTRSSAEGLGGKNLVVSSKRGRSHQNVGSFRDDDYGFHYFEKTDWSIVAVSDGAGSASFSRQGSELACQEVIRYFKDMMPLRELISFEQKINQFEDTKDEQLLEEAKLDAKKSLYKATLHVHNTIAKIAEQTAQAHPEKMDNTRAKTNADYFHATLIFVVFKKFDFGYVFLTFGVGDCPIGIVNKDQTDAKLLNWLDVGEFGGGTRFITQPDIFHSKERPMITRFNVHIQEDFSYLFLMTDGIYDPKFEVEANLEKSEKWLDFIADLKGNNEDEVSVNFGGSPEEMESQLNQWMDFWSKGNHDDRTLAIIF